VLSDTLRPSRHAILCASGALFRPPPSRGIHRAVPDIVVNGTPRAVPDGATVADLVGSLGLLPDQVAVERNRSIVPRAEHATTRLEDGDRVEIVTFVGGG